MDDEIFDAISNGDFENLEASFYNMEIDVILNPADRKTVLHEAVNKSEGEVVKYLVDKGYDVLTVDEKGQTPLHLAVIKNDVKMSAIILENVDRNQLKKLLDAKTKNDESLSALQIAVKNKFFKHASLLLQFGANFEVITNNTREKLVDMAKDGESKMLLQLIDESFARAKKGDMQLYTDLAQCDARKFTSLANCRNNEGRTIMQVILMNNHEELSQEFLWLRSCKTIQSYYRADLYDTLAGRMKLCQEFWSKNCEKPLIEILQRTSSNNVVRLPRKIQDNAVDFKLCCQWLEKVHDFLLIHKECSSGRLLMTENGPLKTLEDILEILFGSYSEKLYDLTVEQACYYKNLPSQWRKNVHSFAFLMLGINASIGLIARNVNSMRLFRAVSENNVDEVKSILDIGNLREGCCPNHRSTLCYAVEGGNKKIIRLLLNYGMEVIQHNSISPIYLAAREGCVKIIKILLKSVKPKDMADTIDSCKIIGSSALHAAAEEGHLDVVKILLEYGATYSISNEQGKTPLDVSIKKEVSDFLKLVDKYFTDAKQAKVELIHKLKSMKTEDFLAITGTKNREGQTLATVAAKAGAKNIAIVILKMIKEANEARR